MHYEANAFIKQGVTGPVIETKAKGYSKYTTDPNQFQYYELGNRLGWAQSDANQLENQYKTVDPQCRASTLAVDTDTDATCISQPYSNQYSETCANYDGDNKATCAEWKPRGPQQCCGCGGGLRRQVWRASDDSGTTETSTEAPTSASTEASTETSTEASTDAPVTRRRFWKNKRN